jgi:hypothetical protein
MTSGLVAIAAQEYMPTLSVLALTRLQLPAGSVIQFNLTGCTLARKRNGLARTMLRERRFQWLLMLDSDMMPPADTIARLLAHGQPIVGALYRQKRPPYPFVAARDDKQPLRLGTLERVALIGAGCLLVRRAVFESLPEPWFTANGEDVGEDADFCRKAIAAGFSVWCDTTLEAGHITSLPVTSELAMGWDLVEQESERAGARGVALLAAATNGGAG